MPQHNALALILREKIATDTLVLPTLPDIALQVRDAAAQDDVNINAMTDVISRDPSLTARIIKIANSAYLGRTVKVNSIGQAVTRIGLSQIKNIATAMAVEQLFESKHPFVKVHMDKHWDNTTSITALAMAALQTYQAHSKDRRLAPDTMTLAGLVFDIGMLSILTETEHNPIFANDKFITATAGVVSSDISEKILTAWEFDQKLVDVAINWSNTEAVTDEITYLDFIRLACLLVNQLGDSVDAVREQLLAKHITHDFSEFESPEFVELVEQNKALFA